MKIKFIRFVVGLSRGYDRRREIKDVFKVFGLINGGVIYWEGCSEEGEFGWGEVGKEIKSYM